MSMRAKVIVAIVAVLAAAYVAVGVYQSQQAAHRTSEIQRMVELQNR